MLLTQIISRVSISAVTQSGVEVNYQREGFFTEIAGEIEPRDVDLAGSRIGSFELAVSRDKMAISCVPMEVLVTLPSVAASGNVSAAQTIEIPNGFVVVSDVRAAEIPMRVASPFSSRSNGRILDLAISRISPLFTARIIMGPLGLVLLGQRLFLMANSAFMTPALGL